MAEYQAPMAEKLRKSVGNVTYYIMHGKTFARAKVAHVKNAKTPKQLRHRATFTMLVQLARVLIETTRTGFPEKAKGRSSSNEFVRANKNFVEVDENYEATIDLEKLQVSDGKLPCFFEVTVTYNADGRMLVFQQEALSNSLLNSDPKDLLYASILETKTNLSGIVSLRARGESGVTSIELPEIWSVENCNVYLFATSENGYLASPSQHVKITTA